MNSTFKKKISIALLTAVIMAIIAVALKATAKNSKREEPPITDKASIDDTSMTATDFIYDITVGINIGNALDSCATDGSNNGQHDPSYYETFWGNPITSKELVKAIHDAGFNTVRIPVTWYYNTYTDDDGNLIIRGEWLERVAEVVNYALDQDMYVILNSHHDAPIIYVSKSDIDKVSKNLNELWLQISEYFKDYDEKLVFESFNEINDKNDSWQYSIDYTDCTNTLNQIFVNTVRGTGSNNAKRVLICSTYLNEATDNILNDFILPTDTVKDKLAISVHIYNSSYGSDLDKIFNKLHTFSVKNNAPVIIDEFGTTTSFDPIELRGTQAGDFVARAADYDIKCVWWDNGKEYGLFDRTTFSITQPDVVNLLTNPAKYN
jgi:aryl-phospho-beta-D-glucosidase BglC (GH1 family)